MAEAAIEEGQTTSNFRRVAAERFGSNYHGKPPEEPVAAEQEPVEPEQPETLLETPEDAPEAAETAEEVQTEDEPADEFVSSLSELAESQEWDPDWVQTLRVPVKIDGETGEATIDQLVRSYQTQEAANNRLEQAKAEAKAIREQSQQVQQSQNAQIAILGALVQQMEQGLDAEAAGIDWASLRENDPGEYAVKKEEMREKRAQLDGIKQQAIQQYQQQLMAEQQEDEQRQAEHLAAEREALLAALPEWHDPGKAKAEQEALVGYLTGQGFSQEDVMGASDHRLILLARKAMQFDQLQQKSNAAAKKVAKVPKVLKPGAPKPQEQIHQEQVAALKRKLGKSGRPEDALALMKLRRKQP